MKRFLITATCFICCVTVFAQQSLRGKVTTADTHKPAALANVFLSNTSIGTVTNDNGEFTIEHFPEGRFDLVVSFIGYESFVVTLQSNKLPAKLAVELKPKVNELQEVIVEPYEKNGWDKWGVFFMENFVGTSSFAEDCKLLNKEMVKFRFNKKANTLKAIANDRLIFENKALGYTLKYDLTRFEYDFNTRMLFYQGYPLFEEMETKRSGIQKRWIKNREDAYYGSLMHFMRSLYRNTLLAQHFEVRKLIKVPDEEKKRVKKLYQAYLRSNMTMAGNTITINQNEFKGSIKNNPVTKSPADQTIGGIDRDTLAYYKQLVNQPESMSVLINKLLPGDSIAYAIDSVTVGFEFSDYLQVIYPLKKSPPEFFKFMQQPYRIESIVSEIFRIGGSAAITVLANGSYFEATDLISSGYWGWSEKIAAMLPIDYWPHGKNKD